MQELNMKVSKAINGVATVFVWRGDSEIIVTLPNFQVIRCEGFTSAEQSNVFVELAHNTQEILSKAQFCDYKTTIKVK